VREHLEIERRFFLNDKEAQPWKLDSITSRIRQCYLHSADISLRGFDLFYKNQKMLSGIALEQKNIINSTDEWTSRIRFRDECATLTLKGKRDHASAIELEWTIDGVIASHIVEQMECPTVMKTRHVWTGPDGLVWEIDVFEGELLNLIIAEVELPNEDFSVVIPSWIGEEITGRHQWSNSSLARNGWP
jgi:CYTH domain-containing protein